MDCLVAEARACRDTMGCCTAGVDDLRLKANYTRIVLMGCCRVYKSLQGLAKDLNTRTRFREMEGGLNKHTRFYEKLRKAVVGLWAFTEAFPVEDGFEGITKVHMDYQPAQGDTMTMGIIHGSKQLAP